MSLIRNAILGFLLIASGGCGTIIHGRDQMVTINSRPSGAQVLYDGAVRGVTPCQVSISRRPLKSIVLLKADSCSDCEIIIENGVSMWALLGNLVIGGIPGWIVDAATGSFGAYYKDSYVVDLAPTSRPSEATTQTADSSTGTVVQP